MIVVVKLGGSLANSRMVTTWLGLVVRHGKGRAVVVPGGGPFADAIRAAQRRHGFSDLAAHRMALLSMHQFGLWLADLEPALALSETEDEIGQALGQGRVPVWLPFRLAGAATDIAPTWDITSDSLAAWLARRLAARTLILVKSAAAPPEPRTPARLAELGLVDQRFPDYAADARFAVSYCGPGDEQQLMAELDPDGR
jgi:aspartokinase-like uncharacterized kinase